MLRLSVEATHGVGEIAQNSKVQGINSKFQEQTFFASGHLEAQLNASKITHVINTFRFDRFFFFVLLCCVCSPCMMAR